MLKALGHSLQFIVNLKNRFHGLLKVYKSKKYSTVHIWPLNGVTKFINKNYFK
jgi:hypothetical protein